MKYIPRILHYLRPHWKLTVVLVALIFLASLVGLLAPWPLQILVDYVLEDRPLPPFLVPILGWLAEDRGALLLFAVIAGLVITLLDNALGVLNSYVQTRIEQRMVLDVRSDLFQHAQHMSMAFHDNRRVGQLIFAINNQGDAVPNVIMSILPIVQNILTLAGMFWIVFVIDRQLALLTLTVLPFLYFSVGYYARGIMPQLRQVQPPMPITGHS